MPLSLSTIITPVLALVGMGLSLGALLGYIARAFRLDADPVVEQINTLLPQTQCGQCGYPGCKPYAQAIADGDAINKCPPGGEKTIAQLAQLLNINVIPLDAQYGTEETRKVARIREAECIGCAKCIPACPVDAILGAPKLMHTVIESECTGCDLCVDPCPVDCIDMIPVEIAPVSKPDTPAPVAYQECINCGLCIDECPVDILPHELYWACKDNDLAQATSLNLQQCIECRKCDRICPSQIPLVDFYQVTKADAREQKAEKDRADLARRRFEAHQLRMTRLNAEAEIRRKKRADLAQNRKQVSQQDIRAALDRVRARKEKES